MSEFSDKVQLNKLIGSNPGYVRIMKEGGQLTETIKNKKEKHCVLAWWDWERLTLKYNIFLQVLDEGF